VSLSKRRREISLEVIVPDNGSTDDSVEMVKRDFPWVKVMENKENLGFAKGNNSARKYCHGEYILFLNSDTVVPEKTLRETVDFLKKNQNVGALTCKLVLANGQLDKDARRSFPTPWVSFTHLILRLDKFFPTSRIFAKYWYGYVSPNKLQEVDVIQGAYFLSPKKVLDEVDWFSEEYFLDGEDVDLCWKIHQMGLKIIYYPKVSILHLKGASKGKESITNKSFKTKVKKPSLSERMKFRMAGVNSMEIFYRKFMWKRYPLFLNLIVICGIKMMKLIRSVKTLLE
jgi:GT2 family glycosyltransferase